MQQTLPQTGRQRRSQEDTEQDIERNIEQNIARSIAQIERRKAQESGMAWEMGGVLALIAAAIACGALAQMHLG